MTRKATRKKRQFSPIKGAEITAVPTPSRHAVSSLHHSARVCTLWRKGDSHTDGDGPPTCRRSAILIRSTSAYPEENNILCKWATRALRRVFFLSRHPLLTPPCFLPYIFPFTRDLRPSPCPSPERSTTSSPRCRNCFSLILPVASKRRTITSSFCKIAKGRQKIGHDTRAREKMIMGRLGEIVGYLRERTVARPSGVLEIHPYSISLLIPR